MIMKLYKAFERLEEIMEAECEKDVKDVKVYLVTESCSYFTWDGNIMMERKEGRQRGIYTMACLENKESVM